MQRWTFLWMAMIGFASFYALQAATPAGALKDVQQLHKDGNYQEALDLAVKLLESDLSADEAIGTFRLAENCMQRLNRMSELDALSEQLASRYERQWQVLAALAQSWLQRQHYGYLIAGEFERGQHRGGGNMVNALERDRVRAMQLYRQARQRALEQTQREESAQVSELLQGFAAAIMTNNDYQQSWRLQRLTDLETLPDYEEGWGYGSSQGAPVDADGNPVFHELPSSWESAHTDGERWRWLLDEAIRWAPSRKNQILLDRVQFLQAQFGVETLRQISLWFGRGAETDPDNETGTFALHTLGENETIARLATGIKRFDLPDEHNHIKLLQQIVEAGKASDQLQSVGASIQRLASIFENRRQYPRAAEYWQLSLDANFNPTHAKNQLAQITGNWGRFENTMSQPAGSGATVDFRFRNGKRVEFTAHRIDVAKLLKDVKDYIKSRPQQIDWNQMQLENLGHRLVTQGQQQYLGEEVARWSLDLDPREAHFDRRITVTTPLQKAGAYLVRAQMVDGNTTSIVLWLNDTAIVRKPMQNKSLYYVADAVTGKPLPKCNVEFFGFWQEHLDANKYQMHIKDFAESTDGGGLIEIDADEDNRRFQWVSIATTPEGRLAFLGFRNIWSGDYYEQQYRQVKVFTVTDRPVYRPDQTLKFKFWVRHAQYDLQDESRFAGQSFQIEIRDPRNEKVHSTQLIADTYGGLEGEWQVSAGATLGSYRINVVNHGGGSFRVEEYKKPEYEVTIDAPDQPVQLGEKITAKISAKYYFGSPVTDATVKYKIMRTPYTHRWYPPSPWDWLYGPGYWWFAEEYSWYPGWARWGCIRPAPWWFWQAPTLPEVIAEQEVPIGPDGTIEVEIDTAVAKQFHSDQDHSYQIQAEVVDQSRRSIVGNGSVLVAREPFKVFVWTARGYYRQGDTITVGTAARTLDGKPVKGNGVLRLLQVKYENAKPVETEVGRWELPTGETGQAELQIKASAAGQYRLSYELTDHQQHTIEGGQVLTVTGEGFDSSQFQFNDLEIIPERREYQAGEKVALQINTNRTGAAVLLFLRPSNGVYLPPKLVRLDGKSKVEEFEVTTKDMPNFFVEAVTVHGGKSHVVTREIFVPPVSRVLNVEVVPSAEAYLPGQAAKLLLKLTDQQGEPFVGSLAVSIYDKAVEYIAGGSNVANIREFFWKWRRNHQPQGETNLEHYAAAIPQPEKPAMQNLGIFGDEVLEESLRAKEQSRDRFGGIAGGRMFLGGEVAMPMSAARGLQAEADFAMPAAESEPMFNDELRADQQPPEMVQPAIRENFADTAYWVASLTTNSEGLAEIELEMPENLTTWKVRAWGMGHGTRVGEGEAEVVTRKNLIVRMQAPRFFLEKDEVVLTANVHNYLPTAKQVTVTLEHEEGTLLLPGETSQTLEIAAGSEARVDWRVTVEREGVATVRMSALTDEESDAMQMKFPVHVHGMLKMDSYTGVVRPAETSGLFEFNIPAERRVDATRLEVRYTPTLAGAMIDALPYLVDYPYGCTEQTLNRFLPAVITQQTLKKMGIDLAAIQAKRTNLNAQEIGDDLERRQGWKRYDRNPVFDDAELTKIVKAGVNRLTEMQLSDGGWGWFSGWGEDSYPHTTAVVMHGLLVARENGVAIVPDVLERGTAWLENYQAEQVRLLEAWPEHEKNPEIRAKRYADNLDALVYMVLAQAERDSLPMREFLYRDRTRLAVYGLANFGIALHKHEDAEKLAMVLRNLGQYVRHDDENQTAWLELPNSGWWYWYGSEYEAHAYYIKLLVATDPQSELAPQLVKYLLNNRKHSTYWNSTRDTALVVEAFADFLAASGEDTPDVSVELLVDGKRHKQVSINRDNLFTFDNKLVLNGEELAAGRHTVEIRKTGPSPIYFNGYVTNFTLEDDIQATGLELKVSRKYFKLTRSEKQVDVAGDRGQVVGQQVEHYDRTPLVNFAQLESGDLVQVELTVESKNDYEYILLEDMKAAGFEPVEVRSGYNGNELGAYMELRDDRVSLFVARLARGTHSVSYRLRAEIPGQFSALPTRASAMYAPELKANSDELKLRIEDTQTDGGTGETKPLE